MAAAGEHYLTRPVHLDFCGTALTLHVPSRLEDHVDAEALLRDADAPEPPYWLHLWAGGRALAREVAARDGWRGARVADVGCGLGLAGLIAARLGARAVLVDTAFDALRLARENAVANGVGVELVQTDVVSAGVRGAFDAVLLADVTYEARLQEALAAFLSAHLSPAGFALCAESVRNHDSGFRLACERRGLDLREWEVREIDDGRPVPVRLSEVRR